MKRIFQIGIVVLILTILLLVPSPASAKVWFQNSYGTDSDNARTKATMSQNAYSGQSFYSQLMGVVCAILPWFGPDACTNDEATQQSLLRQSALGNLAMGIGTMYTNPPANLAYWLKDTGTSLGFVPRQAFAQQQGIGFRGLEPLLPIWKAFRNIAYLLLAIAMVVVGFLVMMRKQIDPKTVVTVQNSLPRIVIALILITFSYAIVGLMIDVMYIMMAFLSVVVQGALPDTSHFNSPAINYANPGFLDLVRSFVDPVLKVNPLMNLLDSKNIGQVAWNLIGGLILNGTLIAPIFQFIIGLVFLFAFIRVFLMLLNNYIQILLAVLIGPLQILIDVFPGVNGFTTWIKGLFGNLVIFPVTAFMLMLGNSVGQHIGEKALWTAPFLPQVLSTNPLGTPDTSISGMGGLAEDLIVMGIVLAIPSVANGIKEMLKAKSPVEAGPGVIFGPLGKSGGTILSAGYQFSMIGSFLGMGKKGPPSGKPGA